MDCRREAVYHSPVFLDRVVEKLLDYILDAENIAAQGGYICPEAYKRLTLSHEPSFGGGVHEIWRISFG
jgi:hypothetical protein